MKRLLMLRHAKSSWDNAALRDFERPLAPRGERDAPRMGEALKKRGTLPDYVLASTATRAKATAELFLSAAGLSLAPQFTDSIYEASSAELMKIIRRLPDTSDCALLVGHNPGFEDSVGRLTKTFHHLPTAALACMEFAVEKWEDIEDGAGTLLWLLTPKSLSES